MKLKRIAYIFIQCTWGAVQSLLGLIAMLLLGNQKRGFYRCAVLTEYDIDSAPKYMACSYSSARIRIRAASARGR